VPFGSYKKITYTHDFTDYRAAFAAWEFTVGDFDGLELMPGDFVYADPPYDVEFTQYSRGGFSWDDQVRTATHLARHRGPVVLVNHATDRIVQLYEGLGYELRFLDGPRRIACTGDRTPAKEVMATRNL
jgi:DNA adenine methylase